MLVIFFIYIVLFCFNLFYFSFSFTNFSRYNVILGFSSNIFHLVILYSISALALVDNNSQ